MSYESITKCTRDVPFQNRVRAAAMKEAYVGGPEFSDSAFAQALKAGAILADQTFIWPLSIDNEQPYAYALDSDNPDPGGDETVITDAAIQSGVQKWWPKGPVPPPPTMQSPPA